MATSIPGQRAKRSRRVNEAHPVTRVREGLVEALVAIDTEDEFLRHFADTLAVLGRVTYERALRLGRVIRPEILAAYQLAETELSLT